MVFTPTLVAVMPFTSNDFEHINPGIFGQSFFIFCFWVDTLTYPLFGLLSFGSCFSKSCCRQDTKCPVIFFFVTRVTIPHAPVLRVFRRDLKI